MSQSYQQGRRFDNNYKQSRPEAISGKAFVTTLPVQELPIPHSPEAEEAVIGSLLIDREVILGVAPVLKPEHFFSQEKAFIYQAMLNLYAEQVPGDMVTLKNELKAMGVLGEGEGQVRVSYLFKLISSTPSPVHINYYVNIILNHWLARQLIRECTQTVTAAYEGKQQAHQILADNASRLQGLATSVSGRDAAYFMSHERSLDYFLKLADQDETKAIPRKDNAALPRLRFGWAEFDGRDWAEPPVLALLPSTLTTIIGRTGGGKTLAALQIADANAQAGLNVLYFHVELNQEQMLARRYCRLTGIPLLAQLLRNLDDSDIKLLGDATGEVSMWPGRVDFVHSPNWTDEQLTQELKARHYSLLAKSGRGYDLVVLDYLQRLGWPRGFSEREALAHNVRRFSDTINELNVAGLMTSQVGRNEAKQFEPPDVDEGLGTGEIERCSNQLLALAIGKEKTIAKYAIRKNTFADSGICGELTFDARRVRFI